MKLKILLVLAIATAAWWFIGEVYTASQWIDPPYNFALNVISDLGVADHHIDTFALASDRVIASPAHAFMNFVFSSIGVIYFFGVGFLIQKRPGVLTWMTGIGLVMLGIFDASNPGYTTVKMVMHWVAGGFAMGGGSLNTYFISKKLGFRAGKRLGVIFSICGIYTAVTYGIGFTAITQRICVYGIFAGVILIALYLYKKKTNWKL